MMDSNDSNVNRNLNLIVKTSFVAFIALIVSKVLAYLYRIVIAKEFGPKVYGLFSLSIMVSGLIIAVASLGLIHGILKYIPFYRGRNENSKIKYLFKIIKSISIFSGIVSGIVLFLISDIIAIKIFNEPDLAGFLRILSLFVTLSIIGNVYITTLRAYEKINWHSFISFVTHNLVSLILIILFIFIGLGTESVPWSYTLSIIVTFIISYLVCRYSLAFLFGKNKIHNKDKKGLFRSVFVYSLPLLFSRFAGLLFEWLGLFSLGYLKGATDVGFYNAAVPIAALLLITPEVFMKMFFPLINREYSKKRINLIKELSKQLTKWIFIINLPVFIIILIFPEAILSILFGQEYLVAKNALRILSFNAIIFSTLGFISHRLILMIGKSKLVLFNIMIASIFNIFMNFILIPMDKILFLNNSNGLIGAASATLLSSILFISLFGSQAYHYLKIIALRRKMIGVFLSGGVATALLILVKSIITIDIVSMVMLTIFFFLSYILLIFITGSLDKNDINIFKSIKNIKKRVKL